MMSLSKKKVRPEEMVTRRLVYACDQGHYGGAMCGHCSADVENDYQKCPKCGYRFESTEVLSSSGGSDF